MEFRIADCGFRIVESSTVLGPNPQSEIRNPQFFELHAFVSATFAAAPKSNLTLFEAGG
jgi:hypothetical protein